MSQEDREALRERVIDAARQWAAAGDVKIIHILTCPDCERLEGTEDRWCDVAGKQARALLTATTLLKDAITALELTQNGEEE